ncbi:MAG: GvpL/GvpF family gas vesicle protein [Deltaproteobacteria bacterium]|nr:GvpL/GvpF family gas vesicle protein [Deltaproteobacteria bacterium]
MACRGALALYAVVPAGEARVLDGRGRGLRCVGRGPVAVLAGPAAGPLAGLRGAALRHDRAVGLALALCSSVVPLRLGTLARDEGQIARLLAANVGLLCAELGRLRGRVEMGLKARLALPALVLPPGLERVRRLAPQPEDRRESLATAGGAPVLVAAYLVRRQDIDAFWSALDELRRERPDVPLVGSGPWAAYSFCQVALRAPAAGPDLAKARGKEGSAWAPCTL